MVKTNQNASKMNPNGYQDKGRERERDRYTASAKNIEERIECQTLANIFCIRSCLRECIFFFIGSFDEPLSDDDAENE